MNSLSPDHRSAWIEALERVAFPVLSHLAAGTLKSSIPAAKGEHASRKIFAPLEAFGRTLAGIAPWLEVQKTGAAESARRQKMAELVRAGIAHATDPASPDYLHFTDGRQPLVDASFLALGLIRSRSTVWDRLEPTVKQNVLSCLRTTRNITPVFNNWLLFSAMIEAFFCLVGEEWDTMRIDYALRQHEQWYKGDGNYGDGPSHHWDYYNSFVIQPFLLEVLTICAPAFPDWQRLQPAMVRRAVRYAAIQERMIAPDGTFPPLGRSIVYRFGVFHHLALMALREELPEGVTPAQVRCGLSAVLERLHQAPGVFDEQGWMTIGLAGCQPSLGESYISTGSLYLHTCGFLPLGLAPEHPFWSSPPEEWTARKIWSGRDGLADHSLDDGIS